jgi:hypothetical protein
MPAMRERIQMPPMRGTAERIPFVRVVVFGVCGGHRTKQMAVNCAYCGQPIDDEHKANVRRARSTRIKLGLASRKAKGQPLGRPRFINPAAVLMMRRNHKSMAYIAKVLCCSKAAVFKILKQQGVTNGKTKEPAIDQQTDFGE